MYLWWGYCCKFPLKNGLFKLPSKSKHIIDFINTTGVFFPKLVFSGNLPRTLALNDLFELKCQCNENVASKMAFLNNFRAVYLLIWKILCSDTYMSIVQRSDVVKKILCSDTYHVSALCSVVTLWKNAIQV